MRRPITATVLTVLAGFAFSGSASLASTYEVWPIEDPAGVQVQTPTLEEADLDGNQRVSVQEAKAAGIPEAEANSADFDDDGWLSSAEWAHVTAPADMNADVNAEFSEMESDDSGNMQDYKDKTNKSGTDKKVYD